MIRSIDKVLDYMRRYVSNPYEHYSEPMLNYKDLELVLNHIDKYKEVLDKIKEIMESNLSNVEKLITIDILLKTNISIKDELLEEIE